MKTVFRILPFLYLFLAGTSIFGAALFIIPHLTSNYQRLDSNNSSHGIALVPLVTFMVITGLISGLYITNGVLMLKRARRSLSIKLSAVACLGFPIGTILGGVSLFALTREEVKREYQEGLPDDFAKNSPDISSKSSGSALAVWSVSLAAFVLVAELLSGAMFPLFLRNAESSQIWLLGATFIALFAVTIINVVLAIITLVQRRKGKEWAIFSLCLSVFPALIFVIFVSGIIYEVLRYK